MTPDGTSTYVYYVEGTRPERTQTKNGMNVTCVLDHRDPLTLITACDANDTDFKKTYYCTTATTSSTAEDVDAAANGTVDRALS